MNIIRLLLFGWCLLLLGLSIVGTGVRDEERDMEERGEGEGTSGGWSGNKDLGSGQDEIYSCLISRAAYW